MRVIKSIFSAILWGAGVTAGSIAVTKGIEVAKDPYKKAKLKRKFNKIKSALTKDED